MSKIVVAVNKMIENTEKITNVRKGMEEREYFFLYDNKFKWSIEERNPDTLYVLFYYGTDVSLEDLASYHSMEFTPISLLAYSTDDIKTEEAIESFSNLYNLVKGKLLGIDGVLDEIING